jgi:hypothetical protein
MSGKAKAKNKKQKRRAEAPDTLREKHSSRRELSTEQQQQ